MRMAESGNVEITNPIYMRDFDDDEPQDLPDVYDFEADKVKTGELVNLCMFNIISKYIKLVFWSSEKPSLLLIKGFPLMMKIT